MIDRRLIRVASFVAGLMVAAPVVAVGQETAVPPGAPAAPASPQKAVFSQPQLDQLLAPIALYPDSLLSQVLMASTYPIEVVQADRWVKANSNLTGDALADALEQQAWDPSVKSLVNFPQVLAMMSDKLDWTTQLGDAFLGQEQQISDTVQVLRAKAQAAGTLKSTPEQQVVVDSVGGPPEIVIQPANPDVVYVPVYDPNVIYGTWWEPSYPPYYYYPPTYVRTTGIWFGPGCSYGVAWGYAWGSWDWRHHDVIIDFSRNQRFNRHIDRDRYRTVFIKHDPAFRGDSGAWQHDPDHRRGVWYRDPATAQRFHAPQRAAGERDREIFRGRDDDRVPPFVTGPVHQDPNRTNPGRDRDRGGDRDRDPRTVTPTPPNITGPVHQDPGRTDPGRERDRGGDRDRDPRTVTPAPPNVTGPVHQDPQRGPVKEPSTPTQTPPIQTGPMRPSRSTDTPGALGGMDGGKAARSESQRGSESRGSGANSGGARSVGSGGGQTPNENRGPSNVNSSGPGSASSGPGSANSGPGHVNSGGNSNAPINGGGGGNSGGGNSGGGRSGGDSGGGRSGGNSRGGR